MGTKTVWRLAFLIGVIVFLAGGGFLLFRFQVGKMARGVVARADRAVERGDFAAAAELYAQHLAILPNDAEVQIKYADSIIKIDRSPKRLQEALAVYEGVLNRFPGREDVRRRAAETAAEMGAVPKARHHLTSLLKTSQGDGHLEYLMGQCEERDKEYASAANYYGEAAKHEAPERLDASQRRAVLLRDRLGRREDADKVIDEMVKSASGDYRAYLGRGRYLELAARLNAGGKGGGDDFRKAMELAPDRPEVYLELAFAELRQSRLDAARAILDKGVEAVPKAAILYRARAEIEQKAGRGDRAVDTLELGLKELPDELNLHWQLAQILAERGDSGKLLLHVAELERLEANRLYTQYLRAYYHFNMHEYAKARQILAPLQPELTLVPGVKALANVLLAKCYAELGEPELQQEATLRAVVSDPMDMTARKTWILALMNRGEIDQAIKECRRLEQERPGLVRGELAMLLLQQNLRLPPEQRQWGEIERLIDQIAAAAPGEAGPALLLARLLRVQGQEAKAFDVLDTARGKYPMDFRPWILEAQFRMQQKKVGEARSLLDRADKQFGDRVELRLARADLVVNQGGPQVIPALSELTGRIDAFSRGPPDAAERHGRPAGAPAGPAGRPRALTRLVEEEPESIKPRIQLFDLALQSKQPEAAEAGPGDRQAGRAGRPVLPGQVADLAGARCRGRREGEAVGPGPRPAERPEAAPPGLVPDPPGPGPAERAGDGSRGTG